MGRLIVHRYAPLQDELLHFQPRTHAGLRKNLVQLGRFDLRQQHALGRQRTFASFIGIKLARNHISELVTSFAGIASLSNIAAKARFFAAAGLLLGIALRGLACTTDSTDCICCLCLAGVFVVLGQLGGAGYRIGNIGHSLLSGMLPLAPACS